MDPIRQAFWEDYVRRVAMAIAVQHIEVSTEICVNRAVELADKVEDAIRRKFPVKPVTLRPEPLASHERTRV